jgi:hypothetical protein
LRRGRSEGFLDVDARVLGPQPLVRDIPCSYHAAPPDDEARGKAGLARAKAALKDSNGNPIVAGLFGVLCRKGLRCIFDRRPRHFIEARLR